MNDDAVIEQALGHFQGHGVEGEIYLERSVSNRIAVHNGAIESLVERRVHGRASASSAGGRARSPSTTDLGEPASPGRRSRRSPSCRTRRQILANVLPSISRASAARQHRSGQTVSIAEKIEIAREAGRRAPRAPGQRTRERLSGLPRRDHAHELRGERISQASRCFAGIELAATDGTTSQTGYDVGWALGPGGLDPGGIGREAARRGVRKLGATQPPTARTAVVLDPEAAAGLFGALAPLFSADAVLKKKSLLAGRTGETIASTRVTLVDDGSIAGGFASSPVDGEGTPTRETILIDGGS
jgi:PmbA protein